MNESRNRAIAVMNGVDVSPRHPKELYYGLAGRVLRNLFTEPMILADTRGPVEFQREFMEEMQRRNNDVYYELPNADQLTMRAALRGYLGSFGAKASVLGDLNSGAVTAAAIAAQIPWTLRSRSDDGQSVSAEQFNGSFRVMRGLMHSHLSALGPTLKLPRWQSPSGHTSEFFPDIYEMNDRGLWLPRNFDRCPPGSDKLGPYVGCPFSFDKTAVTAFTSFVKQETTRPERDIVTITQAA